MIQVERAAAEAPQVSRFYGELARYWPLISPLEEYESEAQEFVRVLSQAAPQAREVLELGSGGGHNAFYMKQAFRLTLVDLSERMLEVSRQLNPDCEHVLGDMRSLELQRFFDAVFVHDAIDYMTSEADLRLALATAYRHCRPGGHALFVPDAVSESFVPSTDCGGSDGAHQEGIRYLAWTYDSNPQDCVGTTHYSFLVREPSGRVSSYSETHEFGLFPTSTWLRLLGEQGFAAQVVTEQTDEDRVPRTLFLCERPAVSG